MQATASTPQQTAAPLPAPPKPKESSLDGRIVIAALGALTLLAAFVFLPIGAALYVVIGGVIPITAAVLCIATEALKPILIWQVFSDIDCDMPSGDVFISFSAPWVVEEFRKKHEASFKNFATFHSIADKPSSLKIKMHEGLWQRGIESHEIILKLETIFTHNEVHRIAKKVVHIAGMQPWVVGPL